MVVDKKTGMTMLQTVVVNVWYLTSIRPQGAMIYAHSSSWFYNPKIKVFMTQDNDCYDIYDSMMVWSNKH